MKSPSPEVLIALSIVLALVPLLIGIGTCYLKCSIVLSLLRAGFGTQSAPSNSLIVAFSVVMSLAIMEPVATPVWNEVSSWHVAELERMSMSGISQRTQQAFRPWRDFLQAHAGSTELEAFVTFGQRATPTAAGATEAPSELGVVPLLGAFVLTEIRRGFVMAFALLVPFFVIDLVVANVLVGLGLTMMSPVVVSLPLKLLLFITCDGWLVLARGLVESYS